MQTKKLFIVLVLGFLLVNCTGVQNKPISPVTISQSFTSIPRLGEAITLNVEIRTLVDAPNLVVSVELPEGFDILSGEVQWAGSLSKGSILELPLAVRPDQLGEWKITVLANNETSRGSFGNTSIMNVNMTESETRVWFGQEENQSINPQETALKLDLKPSSPLQVELIFESKPILNEPVNLIAKISAFVDSPNISLKVNLPDGITAIASSEWSGALRTGDSISIVFPILITNLGEFVLSADAINYSSESDYFGSSTSVYVQINQDGSNLSTEPFATDNSEMSSKDSAVEIHNSTAEQLPLAPISSMDSNTKTQALQYSNPPSTDSVNPLAGTVTVYGYWYYEDQAGNDQPLRTARVEIWDDDLIVDQLLATVYTNASGYYSKTVTNSDESGGIDVYIKVFATDDYAVHVTDALSRLRYSQSNTNNNIADGSHYMGAYSIAAPHGFYIYDVIANDAWQYLQQNVGWDNDYNLLVMWPDLTTVYLSTTDVIKLKDGDRWDEDVFLHEYGHFVMDKIYPSMPSAPNCSGHEWGVNSSLGCAWVEGWATFLQGAIQGSPDYIDTIDNPTEYDLEKPYYWIASDQDEASVLASLWDIFDNSGSSDESFDQLSDGINSIWSVVYNYHSTDAYDFWNDWRSSNQGDDCKVSTIFRYNDINVTDVCPPSVSINDKSQNEGTSPMVFTVSLSSASTSPVNVNYSTSNGTASAPGDYTSTSGTLTIPAGSTTGTISVPIVNDSLDENDETFNVNLSNPANATIVDSQGIGKILDNESTPTLSINDKSQNEGTSPMTFTVTLSGTSALPVSVIYSTSNGTASAPGDYTSTSSTLTIPAGSTTGTISVPIVNDSLSESSETFNVNLSSPVNATITDSQGVGTIIDNDGTPTLSINDPSQSEGTSPMTFTVTLSGTSALPVSVNYSTSNSTAVAPSDYTSTSGTLTIPSGSTSGTISVPIINDSLSEGTETFNVNLSNPLNATITDSQGVGTIIDNDGNLSLSINDVSQSEATSPMTFTVTLSGTSSSPVSVSYSTSNSTAVAPADYTSTSSTLTIPAGSTSGTITVPIVNDSLSESSETFNVNLSNPLNATIADNLGVGTIIDNDGTLTLSINDKSQSEGSSPMTFTVTLSGTSASPVSVSYSTSNGTASAPGDYTSTSGTLAIPAGSTMGTVSVPIINDTLTENSETFNVNLNNPVNATIADNQGVGTIVDNDGATAEILLVDDDDNVPDVRSYYTTALDALGKTYQVWSTDNSDNEPSAGYLSQYETVIWFTGDEFGGMAGPGLTGETALGTWLSTGKCMFISSQDYYFDRGLTNFMTSYLGVASAASDVAQTTVTGTGSIYGGDGPFSLSYPFENYSDRISPSSAAALAFNGNAGDAAVSKDNGVYRTTYLGFPLEALPTLTDRQNVILTFLNWCSSTTSDAKVVINEVDLGDFDAIELYNPTNQVVDLSGWEVIPYGSSGSPFFIGVIPSGRTIPAHGYLLLREGSGTNTATVIYLGGPISWNPDFDGSVALADNSSTAVDFVRWGASSVSPPGGTNWTGTNPASPLPGKNLGRDPLGTDTDAGNDWCDQLASLGVQNTGCTVRINVKIGANLSENYYLTPGLSIRASYAGVDAGPVKVSSTNQVPTIGAERLIYKFNNVATSFTEMMGLPNNQLDTTYWLPWYNNTGLDTQLRFANVSNATASVHVYIGGDEMEGSPFTLLAGESLKKSFPGIDDGPVQIVSDQDIVAAARLIYKVNGANTSFSEIMALPASQLDTTYWLPWYNNTGLDTQLRFANVTDQTASVHIYIGGEEMIGSPFTLQPGESTRKSFPGIDAGPVKIESDQDIVAAERLIYKANGLPTSFTEMMALPDKSLDTTYWLPWYNNIGLDTQLRFANVTDQTASVRIYIGNDEMDGSPFTLPVNGSMRISFPAIDAGPVRIESNVPIVVAERLIYKVNNIPASFSEMMALPNSQLDSTYWFPWYNSLGLDTQLRFGVP